MKILIPAVLAFTVAAGAHAQSPRADYPSCDLPAQRALTGQTGGAITDAGQAHIATRANILQADIGSARKARRLTQAQANTLFERVQVVRRDTDKFTRQQGFLSAAERASYDRELDAVAARVCGTDAQPSQGSVQADDRYLLERADTLNGRIDRAVRARALSRQKGAALRLAVGRVQTFVGNQQARFGAIAPRDADRMNQQLTNVERALPRAR